MVSSSICISMFELQITLQINSPFVGKETEDKTKDQTTFPTWHDESWERWDKHPNPLSSSSVFPLPTNLHQPPSTEASHHLIHSEAIYTEYFVRTHWYLWMCLVYCSIFLTEPPSPSGTFCLTLPFSEPEVPTCKMQIIHVPPPHTVVNSKLIHQWERLLSVCSLGFACYAIWARFLCFSEPQFFYL